MVKKIIWSSRAKGDLKEILQYWIKRNGSTRYSLKIK
jgi:plasmid stabilization system protein ParE